mgnify:CR=1 FL=1
MKSFLTTLILLFFLSTYTLQAQQEVTNDQLIRLYEGLRVADVSDGMDMIGLMEVGLMDPKISPLWKDIGWWYRMYDSE